MGRGFFCSSTGASPLGVVGGASELAQRLIALGLCADEREPHELDLSAELDVRVDELRNVSLGLRRAQLSGSGARLGLAASSFGDEPQAALGLELRAHLRKLFAEVRESRLERTAEHSNQRGNSKHKRGDRAQKLRRVHRVLCAR